MAGAFHEQAVFGAEVVGDLAGEDVGGAGDVPDGRAGESALAKQSGGRREDGRTGGTAGLTGRSLCRARGVVAASGLCRCPVVGSHTAIVSCRPSRRARRTRDGPVIDICLVAIQTWLIHTGRKQMDDTAFKAVQSP